MKSIIKGFSYSWKGFLYLVNERRLWKHCLLPILINFVLLFIFVALLVWLLGQWLLITFPEAWYGVILAVTATSLVVVFFLFIYLMLFAMVGSIIGSPFYEVLAWNIEHQNNYRDEERSFWKELKIMLRYEAEKFVFLGIIHVFLLILFILPGVGTIGYSILGFLATVFFLGFEYLDYAFNHRGWGFTKKRIWCQHHKGVVFGFGLAIFLFLLIPVVNVFLLPIAVAGGMLLFHDYDGL